MKFLKGDFADPSAEAFRENELPRFAIYLRSVVTYFVYPINLSLREIRFESFKFEIQRALNSMEMRLIDKLHSFPLFLLFSLSLSFFVSFVTGPITGAMRLHVLGRYKSFSLPFLPLL